VAISTRLAQLAIKPHLPRRTVRLRLTLLYGLLFLLSGAALLAITYVLVVHNTSGFVFTSQRGAAAGAVINTSAPPRHGQQGEQTVQTSGRGLHNLTPQQARAQARQLQAEANRQHAEVLNQLLVQSAIALAAMALLSIALGWIVAGRVLRPLRTITTAARDISATNLHERLALDGPNDELKELGDTFDALLTRLEAAFQAQRRFAANASHELRTPLARQRTLVQVALADPHGTIESLRSAHERVLASEEQLERLIEALLTLSRGQAGLDTQAPLDLAAITRQVLLTQRPEAKHRGIEARSELSPAAASGDPRLVERLVTNLVDNALRHNMRGGRVEITTHTASGHAVLTAANSGPVIPAAAVDQLLEPFKRLGAERTAHRDGVGLGLGLSIVKAIADAHHATLTIHPRPAGGLHIQVRFPPTGESPPATGTTPVATLSQARHTPAGAPNRSPTRL
jgi:signal transduction histidine kinase